MLNTTSDSKIFGNHLRFSFDIVLFYSSIVMVYIFMLGNKMDMVLSSIGLIALLPLITRPKYLIGPMLFVSALDEYLIAFNGQSFSRFICLYFIIGVLLITIKTGIFSKINKDAVVVVLLMLLGILLSFYGLFGYTSIPYSYIFALLQLFFLLNFNSIKNEELVEQIFVFSSLAIVLLIGILIDNGFTGVKRLSFGDANPNQIAVGIATLFSIIFSHFLLRDFNNKLFHLTLILSAVVFIFLTGSRTSLIACFISAIITTFISSKLLKRYFIKVLFFSAIVGLLLIFICYYLSNWFPFLMNRFTIESVVDSGGSGRIQIWVAFFTYYFPSYWLLGLGFDPFNLFYAMRLVSAAHGAHNLIIDILASTGVLGFVMYFSCFARWLNAMYKGLKKEKLLLVPLSMVLCILFVGIGENILRGKLLWLSFGFGLVMINNLKRGRIND